MLRKRKLESSFKKESNFLNTTNEVIELDDSFISETKSDYSDSDYEIEKKPIKKIKLEKKPSKSKPKVEKLGKVKVKKEISVKKELSTHTIKREIKTELNQNGEAFCNWLDHNLLAEKENISSQVANSIIQLFKAGNTIPFIARYRRDLIDDLDPEKLRNVKDSYEEICSFKIKTEKAIKTIEKSGQLTADLQSSLKNCKNQSELDHIYAPYKPKGKKTLAERAINLGLENLAHNVLNGDAEINLSLFVDANGKEGIRNIEELSNSLVNLTAHFMVTNSEVLEFLREIKPKLNLKIETKQMSSVKKVKKVENIQKFEQYFSFCIPIKCVKPHQTLAINRGVSLKILSAKIVVPDFLCRKLKSFCEHKWLDNTRKCSTRIRIFHNACDDAYKRIILPLIRREAMRELTVQAEKASEQVFAVNLKNLLLEPPVKGKVIMGIDPGFNVGCKVAVISPLGEILETAVIYPHNTNMKKTEENIIENLLLTFKCNLIALGNGKACRETETWLTNVLKSNILTSLNVSYTIVDERGASVYSCSTEAKKEFPNLDPLVISAISLARRIQDPLAELVKVDPKNLGVGMYQHDLHKSDIERNLNEVVSECVSFVGVDLNTASHSLLKRVAGLTSQRADNILKHRALNGPFTNRYQLKDVKGIGEKVFEQCAGFLRVGPANTNEATEFYEKPDTMPLDCTWVHPESYGIAEKLIEKFGLYYKKIGDSSFINNFKINLSKYKIVNLADELKTTETTMKLICEVLSRPLDHDLRNDNTKGPLFKKEITSMDDIKVDINLTGRITNVTHFGAFVDIGVGTNGLIHNSAMQGKHVQLGQIVEVSVKSIEKAKSRIGLKLIRIM